ncbi:MAG: protein kinase domain-containing protein, partial [Polyangiales bacterium]
MAVSPQNDPLVGIELDGRYKLISLLGAGGTGFVYLAEQIGLKRTVAVKMLYAERTQDPANLRRLRREARALAALDHAGIVRVLDYGDGQGCTPYLVMEYARGRPLDLIVEQQG